MFCRICGRKLPDGAAFCMYCGNRTVEVTPRQEENKRPEEIRETQRPVQNRPEASRKTEKPVREQTTGIRQADRKGSTKAGKRPVILAVCIIAAAAVAGFFVFQHFRTKDGGRTSKETESTGTQEMEKTDSPDALVDKWLSGNIDDLAGVPRRSAEEEAEIRLIEEEYGAFFEEEGRQQDANDTKVLKALLAYTDISLKTGFGMKYPSEVEMTVTGPDAAAVMEEINFREYTNPDVLFVAMKNALENGNYEKKTVTLTVTLNKAEDGEIYAEPSEEAVRALYGGLIELDEQELLALYEQLYGEVKGE